MPSMHNVPVPASTTSDPQGFEHLLTLHLEWLAVRNYSAQTVTNRRERVGYFIVWAEPRGLSRPSEITKPILERYQRYLFHYRKDNGDPLGQERPRGAHQRPGLGLRRALPA